MSEDLLTFLRCKPVTTTLCSSACIQVLFSSVQALKRWAVELSSISFLINVIIMLDLLSIPLGNACI